MGQSMYGGNLAEMQQMSQQFGQQSTAVREVVAALDKEAAKVGTAWTGPGAQKFKSAWDSYRAAFQRMATELDDASRVITKYRENIDAATQ